MPASSSSPRVVRWRHWLLVAEAAALLLAARLLVAAVPFEKWRASLGIVAGPARPGDPSAARAAKPYAAAVRRALARSPVAFKCLPQAMALQWMLRRRAIRSVLTIAALPRSGRRDLDSLHAWVAVGGEILLGASDLPYVGVLHLDSQDQ